MQPPTPSWGAILSAGRNYVTTAWWIAVFPGLFLFLLMTISEDTGLLGVMMAADCSLFSVSDHKHDGQDLGSAAHRDGSAENINVTNRLNSS